LGHQDVVKFMPYMDLWDKYRITMGNDGRIIMG
jgi:hypothetical protein